MKGEMQGSDARLNIFLMRTKPATAGSTAPPVFDVASVKRSPPFTPGTRVEKRVTAGRFVVDDVEREPTAN
jgi:hypothetical protein